MRYFEDFQVGERIALGSTGPLTEEAIIAFAQQYDPQPFHVDPELAKASSFGGLIASGWHTGSLFMRLLADNLLAHTIGMGSPGIDEVRWRKPVRPGDTLHGYLTVVECTPSRSRPNMGILRSLCEVVNQHDDVVMSFVGLHLFGRRPTSSSSSNSTPAPTS